jgi:hypothetical protein
MDVYKNLYEEDELTIKEFFEKLYDRLQYTDPKTGEKSHRYTQDGNMVSTFQAFWKVEELDDKLHNRNAVWGVLFTLYYLRRAVYEVIRNDLKSNRYRKQCIDAFDNMKDDYDKDV